MERLALVLILVVVGPDALRLFFACWPRPTTLDSARERATLSQDG